MFQSLSVLASYEPQGRVPPHDYLDDLESFFFVLVYTFLIHRPDGSRVLSTEDGPSIVAKWDHPDPAVAGSQKEGTLGGRDGLIATRIIKNRWGNVCSSLYRDFSDWMSDTREEKLEILGQVSEDGDEQNTTANCDPLSDFHSRKDEHYARVLALFDNAIADIEAATHDTCLSPAISPAQTGVDDPPFLVIEALQLPVTPPPALLLPPPQVRRSSRIREIRHGKGVEPPHLGSVFTGPCASTQQPRRSARILKRRLETTEELECRPSKTRRVRVASRTGSRTR